MLFSASFINWLSSFVFFFTVLILVNKYVTNVVINPKPTSNQYFNNVNLTPTDNIITIQSLELNTITYSSELEKNFNIIGKTI